MRVTATLAAALTAAAGLITTAGPAAAAPVAHPVEQVDAASAVALRAGFFQQLYRGHHIMGWGHNESACAYIGGVQLVLYPLGRNQYLSALQAYEQERGVEGITKASVDVLGDADLLPPADPVAHCPEFVTGLPVES
ncbi:tyrosinase family oxidase copper chaperone [Actinoplanes sp. NPDC051346]|uniref:tyrosinase family oxidase copper chaperone n=1 Tax=Actinoplanes sp. NPDC051346 TaxID=3155048 RepID=UPI0034420C2B